MWDGPEGEVGNEAASTSVSVRVTSSCCWTDMSPTTLRRAETSACAMACASCGDDPRAVTSTMRLFVLFDSSTAPVILSRSIPVDAAT